MQSYASAMLSVFNSDDYSPAVQENIPALRRSSSFLCTESCNSK
nr:truncated sex-determining region Y protein [Homo sapiens]